MSALEVLLGDPVGIIKTIDGRSFRLSPLRLSDIVRLERKFGPGRGWHRPEVQERMQELETMALIVWLSLRHDPAAKDLTEEGLQDLFEAQDVAKLAEAGLHVMEISGLLKKEPPAPPEAPATTGPGSGST